MKKNKIFAAFILIFFVFGSCINDDEVAYNLGPFPIINQLFGIATDRFGNVYFTNSGNHNILKINTIGKITEVAGTNTIQGCDGDGGSALSAHLTSPLGIATDASGNLFFLDSGCNLIHKINASNGYMYAIAGNGTQGDNGDGGQATAANINAESIAMDTLGNLYITESLNDRIREVNLSSGIITTIAGNGTKGFTGDGGLATSAELNHPYFVALDDSNNIYIADEGNFRIRKINAITHIITTVAGTGVSGYNGDNILATSATIEPGALAIDKSRNIYFCDGNSVRKINAQTGLISTVAGNRITGYTGDGGLATSAELNGPSGIALDASSAYLYIVDSGNDAIRKLTIANDFITTVAHN